MTPLNVVPFVSVDNMMKLVLELGLERVLVDLAAYIETDFKRWPEFDKTPRVASHSDLGVIELMPTSDGEFYGFKYVNGHPKNRREGLQTVTAFGRNKLRLQTASRNARSCEAISIGSPQVLTSPAAPSRLHPR